MKTPAKLNILMATGLGVMGSSSFAVLCIYRIIGNVKSVYYGLHGSIFLIGMLIFFAGCLQKLQEPA